MKEVNSLSDDSSVSLGIDFFLPQVWDSLFQDLGGIYTIGWRLSRGERFAYDRETFRLTASAMYYKSNVAHNHLIGM